MIRLDMQAPDPLLAAIVKKRPSSDTAHVPQQVTKLTTELSAIALNIG